jgi:hypothetical protein
MTDEDTIDHVVDGRRGGADDGRQRELEQQLADWLMSQGRIGLTWHFGGYLGDQRRRSKHQSARQPLRIVVLQACVAYEWANMLRKHRLAWSNLAIADFEK